MSKRVVSVMNKEVQNEINEQEKRLDEVFFQLGDVLDVKASVVLVVISFLGAISGQILTLSDLPLLIKVVQFVGVAGLATAVVLTVVSLWPRVFDLPKDREEWVAYAKEVDKHFEGKPDAARLTAERVIQSISEKRHERIVKNRALAG